MSAQSLFLFKDLLGAVPEDANALVLVHAERLRESAVGREFRERTLRGSQQVDKHLIPRKEVERVVLAAELNARLDPNWEVAVVQVNQNISMTALAAQSLGKADMLGPYPSLYLDTNAYLIELKSELYGVYTPASRQRALRWADRTSKDLNKSHLSPYLSQIAQFPETAGTEIMLALDLTGMVDPKHLSENLQRSEVLAKQKSVDRSELTRVLGSIEGVALGVMATDTLNAKLRVDFGISPLVMKDFAKPLLLEKLGDLGLMVDDFERWEASVSGKTVYLAGNLSPSGLRRVLSVVDPPNLPASQSEPTADTPSASELDPMALPSQRYFKEITTLLDDTFKRENAKYAKQASWYDKYARKISQLSMVNVDPELVDYGLSTTMAFSSMANSLRKQSAEASQYSHNRWTYYNVYGDAWNGYAYSWQTDPSERSKAEKQAKMYGAMSYADTVQAVTNSTVEMRRKMVERYKISF